MKSIVKKYYYFFDPVKGEGHAVSMADGALYDGKNFLFRIKQEKEEDRHLTEISPYNRKVMKGYL